MTRSKTSTKPMLLSVALVCCSPQPSAKPTEPEQPSAPVVAADTPQNPEELKELKRLEEEAKQATDDGDWISAKQLIQEGLQKTEQSRDLDMQHARFLLLNGEMALHQGDRIGARRHLTDAMAIFHVRKNDPGRFETFMVLGRLEARSGDYAAAARQFDEAKILEPKVTNKTLKGRFLMEQGRLAAHTMDHKKAADLYAEALLIFDALKNNRLRAETLLLLAQEEEMLGRIGSAKQSLHRASKLFAEADNLTGKVKAVHRLATYAEREKQYAVARRLFNEALSLYEQLDQQTAATSVARHLSALPQPDKGGKKKKK